MWQRFNMHHGLGLLAMMLLPLILLPATTAQNPAPTNINASTTSSYIVQAASAADAKRHVVEAGGTVTATLSIINAVGADLSEEQVAWLRSRSDRITVYKDGSLEVSGAVAESHYPTLIGADRLHARGITGQGVTVAVLDTGLWKSAATEFTTDGNPRVLAQYDATLTRSQEDSGCRKEDCDDDCRKDCDDDCRKDCDDDCRKDCDDDCRKDCDDDDKKRRRDSSSARKNDIDDWNGHGTHITSIIMSSDRTKAGRYQGVAPDANVVVVRAFEPDGSGTYLNVIKALEWIVAHRRQYDIRILNLSFGAPSASHYWDDPVNQAVMAAWQRGIIVVVAAGNKGPGPMTIGVPGNVPYVITVGAMTDNYTPDDSSDDRLASFSAAGPTIEGFVKPELVAPGGHMLGQMPPYAWLPLEHPEYVQAQGDYFRMSGTSQSAAVVSGVLALMLQVDPWLRPDYAKCRLTASARTAIRDDGTPAYSVFQQGAGLVDAIAAINARSIRCANRGMSVWLDLWRIRHYAGPAGVDENGTYYLVDRNRNRLSGSGFEWRQATLWSKGAMWPEGYLSKPGVYWNRGIRWNDTSSLNPDSLLNQGSLWPEGALWPQGLQRPASTYVWVDAE